MMLAVIDVTYSFVKRKFNNELGQGILWHKVGYSSAIF